MCLDRYWEPGSWAELSHETTTVDDLGVVTEWYVVLCFGPDGSIVYQWDPYPLIVRDLAAVAESVRDQLVARLQVQLAAPEPAITMAPPVDATHLVGLATWFWAEPTSFETISQQASDPAGLTVTLTATPIQLRVHPGDGDATGIDTVITCTGAGVAWQTHRDDNQTDCLHPWDQPSRREPDGHFTVHAEADWDYTWTATGELAAYLPATTGTLGTITTTTPPLPITVVEAQAVIID